ncbi:hypothetical protein NMG60_11022504 [Bertholletia excelsa]
MATSERSSGDSESPEFEFWKVRNLSFHEHNLLSADELFADGVLLPLHHLCLCPRPEYPNPHPSKSEPITFHPVPSLKSVIQPEISPVTALAASKKCKGIFQKSNSGGKGKEKKTEGKVSSAEMNKNIWPFHWSRSLGSGGVRARMMADSSVNRKVNSAPCSRSNSTFRPCLAKSRLWKAEKSVAKEGSEARRKKSPAAASCGGGGGCGEGARAMVSNCRWHLICGNCGRSAVAVGVTTLGRGGSGSGDGGSGGGSSGNRKLGGNLFKFNTRDLLTRNPC